MDWHLASELDGGHPFEGVSPSFPELPLNLLRLSDFREPSSMHMRRVPV